MTLDQLASLAEIAAALAVVASLVYLSIQLRQNTIAIKLSTARSVTEELQGMVGLLASDESLAEVFVNAAHGSRMSDVARVRYYAFTSNLVRVYENAYLQNQKKAIDEAHWAGMTRMLIDITSMPAFSTYWADRMHWFSDDFQQHMNSEIIPASARTRTNPPGDYSRDSRSE